MVKIIPVLGPEGYATDIKVKLQKLMAHLLLADASQSTIYLGNVISVPAIVKEFQSEPEKLTRTLEDKLAQVFTRNFDRCNVRVTTTELEKDFLSLQISAVVYQDNKSYQLLSAFKVEDGTLKDYIEEIK